MSPIVIITITVLPSSGVSEDILPVITTNTEEAQQASLCDDIPVLPGQVNSKPSSSLKLLFPLI
jgi:hypothetical protein